jgi:uncharacterized membrane protein YoaK (UPF0700 family)
MAFQAGTLNIGGFLTCKSFVSHVTGFATLFGYEVQRNNLQGALVFLSVPLFFLIGAMISGLLVDLQLKLHHMPRYYVVFSVLFVLNLLVVISGNAGFFGPFGEFSESFPNYILLILLSLICGIQNGTITSISSSVVRTTHLTGITTDLGIGIMRLINKKHFADRLKSEQNATYMRIGLIVSFGLGSICGGLAFTSLKYFGFIIPVIISGGLFILMFYFQVIKKNKPA